MQEMIIPTTSSTPPDTIPDLPVPHVYCYVDGIGGLYPGDSVPPNCSSEPTETTTLETTTTDNSDTTSNVAVKPKETLPKTGVGETVSTGSGAALALTLAGAALIRASRRRPKNKA